MKSPMDVLVDHARTVCTAHEWLYDLSNLERQLIAQTAANLSGTVAIEPDTVVVRQVYNALLSPPVVILLGDDHCVYCDRQLVGDDCPEPSCEANYRRPRSLDRFGGRQW